MRNDVENGLHYVSLELAGWSGSMGLADYLLNEYFLLIHGLSKHSKKLWANCSSRVFNLGFQSGFEPHASHEALSSATLAQLAAMQASLIITIYATPSHEN